MGEGKDEKVPLDLVKVFRICVKILLGKYTHKHTQCSCKLGAKKCKNPGGGAQKRQRACR